MRQNVLSHEKQTNIHDFNLSKVYGKIPDTLILLKKLTNELEQNICIITQQCLESPVQLKDIFGNPIHVM